MRIFIAALVSACLCAPASAESDKYYVEGVFGGGSGNIEVDEPNQPEVEFNSTKIDLTVNFGSVSSYAIPYNETQHLNQSSFVSVSQENLGTDGAEDVINREVEARMVFGDGLFITAIASIDDANNDDADNDDNVYEIRLGQYTDNFTSSFAGYVIDNLDNVEIFTFGFHTTGPYSSESSWLAYDFGGRYLTEGDDSEYAVNLGVSYYPSFRSALGVWYEFADGRLTNSHETNLFGEFYFSHRFSVRADYTTFRFGNVDENSATGSVKIRF